MGQHPFLRQSLSLVLGTLTNWPILACRLPGVSSRPYIPSSRITRACHHTCLLMWILRLKLKSSCLLNKYFNSWIISLAQKKAIFLNELHFIKNKKLKTHTNSIVCLPDHASCKAHLPLSPGSLEVTMRMVVREHGSEVCSWDELLIFSLPQQRCVSWGDRRLAAFASGHLPTLSFSFRRLVSS